VQKLAGDPSVSIKIVPQRGVRWGRVVDLFSLFDKAGFKDVGVMPSTNRPENQPATHPASQPALTDEEYQAIVRRVFDRVFGLRKDYPSLEGISQPAKVDLGDWSTSTLRFTYKTTWKRQDPAEPVSKRNGEYAVFDKGGYWFQLHFYRGRYEGAAKFAPIDFGDLNLWFLEGYDDPAVIQAVSLIVLQEQEALAKAHSGLVIKRWILDRAKLPATTTTAPTSQPTTQKQAD
jgi:hypothetical protein